MPQKSLFSRLKAGDRITVGYPRGESFEIEWGPRGPDAALICYLGGGTKRSPMSESECYEWLEKEQANGLVETTPTKPAPSKKPAASKKTKK